MTVIDVVTAGLRAHADRVDDVGDRLDTARGAAAQVCLTREAYGMLCSPLLVPVLGALEGAGIAGITAGALGLEGTALALRAMANSLDTVDEIAANQIDTAGRR